MAGPNDYSAVPQRNPLTQLPQPNYNPLGSGNPQLDMMFAMLVPPMLGPGKFLPQQFPAQGLLDQFMSNKYNQASRGVEMKSREADQETIYSTMLKVRGHFSSDPLTGNQQAQLEEGASFLNSMPVQMMAEMLLGPQHSEDIFFGRKGSKARLARGVGRVGFSRRDSVSGADSMSAESMQTFTDQIYGNLYGPGTDMNDISGFSAGRVGDIMGELAQRGLLPQSASALNSYERRKTFADKSLRDPSFSADVNNALDQGATVDELTKLEGGADAVRKIDANRVTNTLKGYTDALSAVREIFGDNGMSGAPMGQLMAAMDALTQNSMSSMSPDKVENLMRRVQMASRDSGVSLEALMGLTARGGALADQYGLSRGIATENVIGAMERGKALEDTGGFLPGFGRMDKNKATLFALDQGMRADASSVGRLIGVANRIVEENKDENGNLNADFAKRGKSLVKMVEALKRGDATYYDEDLKKEVNVYQAMGENPAAFFKDQFDRAGVSSSRASAYYRDSNTQEFMIANRALNAQAYELKQTLGANFAGNSGIDKLVAATGDADKAGLQSRISQSLATSLVDTINTTHSAEERINILQSSMSRAVAAHVRETNPKLSEDEVSKRAKALMTGAGGMFKNETELREFLSTQQGEAGVFVEANYGMQMGQMQQMYNLRGIAETRVRQQRNLSKAQIFDRARIEDGSNFLQRLSDSGGNVMTAFNVITDTNIRKQLYEAVGEGNNAAGQASVKNVYAAMDAEYKDAIANDEDVIKQLASGGEKAFEALQDRLVGGAGKIAFDGKKNLLTTAQLTANIKKTYEGGGANKDAIRAALAAMYGADDDKIDKAIASGDAFKDLADAGGIRAYLNDDAEKAIGLGAETMTEREARDVLDPIDVLKDPAKKERIDAYRNFATQLSSGNVTASGIVGLFGNKITNKKKQTALEAAIDGALTDHTDADKLKTVEEQLKTSGLTDAQQQVILDSTKMGRAHKVLGGMAALGDTSAHATAAAIEEQIKKGNIAEDSEVGKIMRGDDAKKKLELAKDRDKLEAALKADEDKRLDQADGKGKSTAELMQDIDKDKQRLSGETAAADPTGIGDAIASSVGPAIGESLKEAFKGNITLDNVTIAKVDLPTIGEDIVKAVQSAMGSETASGGGKLDIIGTLRMVGVDAAVLAALPKDNTERTPGGPSVRA